MNTTGMAQMHEAVTRYSEQAKDLFDEKQIAARKLRIKATLCCPYCDVKLSKWRVPDSPFTEWSSEFQYICFNDECAYFLRGWAAMAAQANFGSYRFMYDPDTDGCHPIAVLSENALKEGIVVIGGC
jgi:hypothetical protein